MATATADHPLREEIGVTSPSTDIEFLNILLYGDPGVGKTYLCGTAVEHDKTNPVLLIDIEGGTLTVRDRKIDVVSARTLVDVQKIVNKLITAGEDMYYKTVVLDSLTELQKLDMRYIMKQAKANAKNPDSVDVDVPSQREWGKSLEHTRSIVRAFRDLPCNTIITALAHQQMDDSGSVTGIFPSLPGKARNEIPGFMDVVGYYHVRQAGQTLIRRVQFAKTSRVQAKDRTGLLGDAVDDPSFPQLFDMIHK
jgi:phage nucleotide-binding protein